MIEIKNLNKSFGTLEVLKEFNLNIEKGETMALVGPSGCGKSTLLNCITGLENDFEGEITINNLPSKEYLKDKRIAVVLQKYSNFEWLTVIGNIENAFLNSSTSKLEKEEIINLLIKKTGLNGFENSYMNELSGGMQQRVAVARALAQNSEILAFDEPFGALDVENRVTLQNLFKIQLIENNLTAIFITHDIEEAILIAEKVAILKKIPSSISKILETKDIVNKFSKEFTDMKKTIENNLKE